MLLGVIAKQFTTTLTTNVKKKKKKILVVVGVVLFSCFTPSLAVLEMTGSISILLEGGNDKDHDCRAS